VSQFRRCSNDYYHCPFLTLALQSIGALYRALRWVKLFVICILSQFTGFCSCFDAFLLLSSTHVEHLKRSLLSVNEQVHFSLRSEEVSLYLISFISKSIFIACSIISNGILDRIDDISVQNGFYCYEKISRRILCLAY
jgi:hypothetical protein